MKGRRICRKRISNWLSTAWPKVSAVMPVPSETKKTVRAAFGLAGVLGMDMMFFRQIMTKVQLVGL